MAAITRSDQIRPEIEFERERERTKVLGAKGSYLYENSTTTRYKELQLENKVEIKSSSNNSLVKVRN